MPLIPIPYARKYRATVAGTAHKRVTCFSCQRSYEYEIKRQASGEGTSALFLDNNGAKQRSLGRASEHLSDALRRGNDPVPCPLCGVYQPKMVEILREKHGRDYDPNIYARKRAGTTDLLALQKAMTENSEEAYRTFIQTWPHSSLKNEAQVKLYEIEGRQREQAWTPTARRRAIVIRVLIAVIVFGGLGFMSWKFGSRY